VKRAYLEKGKQFTQNYRWSFKYLQWRSAQAQPLVNPEPPSLLSAVPQ
jgi:hypothetical protein